MSGIAKWGLVLLTLCNASASAQSPASPKGSADSQNLHKQSVMAASNGNVATPESLAVARVLVAENNTGKLGAMEGLSLPFAKILKTLRVGPEHAQMILHSVVIGVLSEHSDELSEIMANSYASNMSLDDLKASAAFFATPAGKNLAQARSRLMMSNMNAVNAMLDKLMPEIQTKTDEVMKEQGWSKIPAATEPALGPRPLPAGH